MGASLMKINIVAVGNLKEKYLVDAQREYEKRLNAFCDVEIREVKEFNGLIIDKEKECEGKEIERFLKGFTIALEIGGKSFTSEEFSEKLKSIKLQGHSTITFVIGGSNGIDKAISDKCNLKLSFSSFTFPHQLMRVILLEQIYRAFCISSGKTYHK